MTHSGRQVQQWNILEVNFAELGLTDIAGKARAMMIQANIPEEIKYKLYK